VPQSDFKQTPFTRWQRLYLALDHLVHTLLSWVWFLLILTLLLLLL